MSIRILLALCALCLSACLDPMSPGWRVEDPRVLGARVSVVGDEARATPAPGESASVTFFVAEPPAQDASVAWAFVPCVKQTNTSNLPICKGMPLVSQLAMGTGSPTMTITVPDAATLGADKAMLVLGVLCFDGVPSLDAQTGLPGCSAGTLKSQAASLDIDIALDEAARNRNVSMATTAITLDGEAWDAALAGVPAEGCGPMAGTASLPRVGAAGLTHVLRVDLSSVDRETFTRTIIGTPPRTETVRETLQLSHFTTLGDLERQFSFVEGEADFPPMGLEIDWTEPKTLPADGTRIDFYFVLRDGRGGTDWIKRSVCAVSTM